MVSTIKTVVYSKLGRTRNVRECSERHREVLGIDCAV